MFDPAGISAEIDAETQPERRPSASKKKQEITDWLKGHGDEIASGQLVVFFEDECHLLWGDLCGYIWGKTAERIKVPIINERSKQTYYGAVNLYIQQCLIQGYEAGNSENTKAFLKYLLNQFPESRIALIWELASYHRSQEIREYLESVNLGLDESKCLITCIRFAPNAPQQNPIEDIWLQAKRFIREYYHRGKSFGVVKYLFELVTHRQSFDEPKLFTYGYFSQLI